MKKIVIIGNAKIKKDYSILINNADIVVRFNDAGNYYSGLVGSKTDVLCIANISHPGRRFSKYKIIKKLPFIDQVKTIWFPYFSSHKASQFWLKPITKSILKQTNYCDLIIKRNCLFDKNVLHFGKQNYDSACNNLNIANLNNLVPSSGYLAIKYILDNYSVNDFEIIIIGFTFSGCACHFWDKEKTDILFWKSKGLITHLE